jgi:hypothetical protein
MLKGHWKIICSIVSSGGLAHIRQLYLVLSWKCHLLSIFLVLSLTDSTSQQKNLILGVHFDFHSQRKEAWGLSSLKQNL